MKLLFTLAIAGLCGSNTAAFVVNPVAGRIVESPQQALSRTTTTTADVTMSNLNSKAIGEGKKATTTTQLKMGAVELVDPSYNLAIGAFGLGLLGGVLEDARDGEQNKLPTAPLFGGIALLFTIFAAFLTFQTTTLRFSFDDDSFALVKSDGSSLGENVVVGGENKWAYSSFVNWDFLPSSNFPILVYFRETQTPIETREEVPLVIDNLDGQVHFFPAIANSAQMKAEFMKHQCAHISDN